MEVYSLVSTVQCSQMTSHLLHPGHWVCSCKRHLNSMGSIQARTHGHSYFLVPIVFHSQIFMRYPYRYPFLLLGQEGQSKLCILPRSANTAARPGFEPTTLWSRAQHLTAVATMLSIYVHCPPFHIDDEFRNFRSACSSAGLWLKMLK